MELPTPYQKNLHFIKIMQEAGINTTTQRLQICRLLLSRRQHITIDGIFSYFYKKQESISRATIYNTLYLFIEKGLMQSIQIDAKQIFYDSYAKPHHHFYNVDTGELIDIEAEDIDVLRKIDLPYGMDFVDTQVVIRVCNKNR